MNWRERYARYRRYGLDPLPQDADGAQREARIAELRTLRRARQRKVALRSGFATLLLVAGIASLLYWLLMTIGGRDVLLRQIVARGARWEYAKVDGRWAPVGDPRELPPFC